MKIYNKLVKQHDNNARRTDELKNLCGERIQTDSSNLVYGLPTVSLDRSDITFLITGCQGAGNQTQKTVARAMTKTYEQNYRGKNIVGLLLGDNVYDYGATSAKDPAFYDCFSSLYPHIIIFPHKSGHQFVKL